MYTEYTTALGTQKAFSQYLVNESVTAWRWKHGQLSPAGQWCLKGVLQRHSFLYTFFSLRITEMWENDMTSKILYLMFWAKEVTEKRVWIPVWESLYSVIHGRYDHNVSCVDWVNEFIKWSTKRYVQWLRVRRLKSVGAQRKEGFVPDIL